jgi:histidyl-tRNA synthetase
MGSSPIGSTWQPFRAGWSPLGSLELHEGRDVSKETRRPKARLARGLADVMDDDVTARQEMIATISAVYRRYGFQALETPVLEYLDAIGKFLPDVDAPGEGVFALRDDDEQWLALRYDLTAPLARFVAEHRNDLTLPYRRFQVGPVFRQEKPGPGRFRQFYQCDFDTVGSRSMAVDAEVCALLAEALQSLGITPGTFEIRVNDRKVLNGILAGAGVADGDSPEAAARRSHVLRSMDKFDRVGLDGVRLLLGPGRRDESGDFSPGVGLDDAQIEQVVGFVSAGGGTRGEVIDRLRSLVGDQPEGLDGVEELATIDGLLTAMGIDDATVIIDPTVVRGLDYYTGPVFEAVLTDGSFGSVAAGGRYDDLVRRFTGQDVPACGASIGVDRLLATLRHQGKVSFDGAAGPVVVTVMDRQELPRYQTMVAELRAAGFAAELYLGNKGLGDQLKYADRRRSPLAVIAGSNEFAEGTVVVKNLLYGKEVSQGIADRAEWLNAADVQHTIPRNRLVTAVADLLTQLGLAP